jgi:hypothetical protein
MVRHPGLFLMALVVTMLAGSLSVSSTVEVATVGTSWLGLDSAAGLGVSIACSILALVAVAFLVYVGLSAGYGEDDDDGRGGDDEPPAPEGPSGEPVWWPEFERELAAYLREPSRSGSDMPSTVASSSV